LQDGDRCFDRGDYVCAQTKYNEVFKSASGKDKQIAEIKLTRTKWCTEHLKVADQAFANKNYLSAKENYQSVLETNPNDLYANEQLVKCNNYLSPPITTLSVSKENLSFPSSGGNESITVITNANLFSINLLPSWCSVKKYEGYFIVSCSANSGGAVRTDYFTVIAGEKVVRINISQTGNTQLVTTLSTSTQNISFISSGGSTTLDVKTNASNYQIVYLPLWCKVGNKLSTWFSLVCEPNNTGKSRSDWFKVKAGDKEVKIYVYQAGSANTTSNNNAGATTSKSKKPSQSPKLKCFNCPNTKYNIGITTGYIQSNFNHTDGIQLGLRIEPLFKYGFGLNTGLNFEGYSTDISSVIFGEEEFELYGCNIPFHIEYRLNFSKWFNIFSYGGVGVNILTVPSSDVYTIPTAFEYGGGIRINRLQFNIGQSMYLGDLKNNQSIKFYRYYYQGLVLSFSWMF